MDNYPVEVDRDVKDFLSGMTDVLDGSRYSIPDINQETIGHIKEVLEIKENINSAWADLREAIGHDDQIVETLQERWRGPLTFHSNRLEKEGPESSVESERITQHYRDRGVNFFSESPTEALTVIEALTGDDRIVVSHDSAFEFALYLASEKLIPQERDLRDINRLLETGKDYRASDMSPGGYAKRERYISRDPSQKPQSADEVERKVGIKNRIEVIRKTSAPVDISSEINELIAWLKSKEDKTKEWGGLIATCAHAWLTDIHPFEDGNGRTARLLANLLLAHGDLPPLVIKSTTDRPRYLDALIHSDEAGDIFPLFKLFMEIRQRKVNELVKNPSFATAQFNLQIKKERRADFDLWLGEVKQMRERLGIRLKPDLQLIEESLPDFDDYYLYTQRSPAPKIWFGRINKRDGSPLLLLWIGFCTRVMTECLDELGSTLYPSIYFDLISPNSYGKSWGPAPDLSGGRFTIDELNVGVPNLGESRCEVRFLNKESLKNFGLDKRFKRGSQVDIQNFNLDQVLNYLVKDIQKLTDRDGEILT